MKKKIVLLAATAAITVCGLASAGPPQSGTNVHDFEISTRLVASPTDNVVISPADNLHSQCASGSLLGQLTCAIVQGTF